MKKNNKKLIKNPVMVDKKNVKNIKYKNNSGDETEIKSFIVIIIVIVIVIGIIYGLTELLKKEEKIEDNVTAVTIDYDKISVGTLLNRPYEEYYVLIYNSEDEKAINYSTLMTKYMQTSEEKDYIKIYYCDLANSLNNKYYNVNDDNMSNNKASSIEELDFGDLTLIKVSNGKITNYIEDYNDIKEILK